MTRYLYARKASTWFVMKATQETIDVVIDAYNKVTKSHKRAPVEKYVQKQLAAGEAVDIVSGHPRWSSAVRFSGEVDALHVEFLINPALPEGFKKMLETTKQEFESLLSSKDL